MNRRNVLVAGCTGLLSGCAGSSAGFYDFRIGSFPCGDRMPRGTRVYPARLRRFSSLDLEEQATPELCWAAAIQAVLQYHGRSISQEEIVQKVSDSYRSSGYGSATLREIIRGIGGPWRTWLVNNGNSNALVADLSAGNPVIMGLREDRDDLGHVVVVYGATYANNFADGRTYIDQVWYWDPWYGEGFRVESGCYIRDRKSFALHAWGPV